MVSVGEGYCIQMVDMGSWRHLESLYSNQEQDELALWPDPAGLVLNSWSFGQRMDCFGKEKRIIFSYVGQNE